MISYIEREYVTSDDNKKTDVTCNVPRSTLNGDTLILILALNRDNPDSSYITPGEWSLIVEESNKGSGGCITAWYRTANSEPKDYTPQWTNGSESSIEILLFTGCTSTSSPIDSTGHNQDKGLTDTYIGTNTPTVSKTMAVASAFMSWDDSTGDRFNSFYDNGTYFSWTQLTDIGDTNKNQPCLGTAYTLEDTDQPTTLDSYAQNVLGSGFVSGFVFNLFESSSIVPPDDIKTGITYSAPGTYYLTIPYGCVQLEAKAWGAGGCGSGSRRNVGRWGGGGGGGFGYKKITDTAAPGRLLKITVGAGGTSAGTNNGGDSKVELSSSTWNHTSYSTLCVGYGGAGLSNGVATGGAGGGGYGDLSYSGGTGGTGGGALGGNTGGGGGGAGDSMNGTNGGTPSGGSGGSYGGQTGGNGRSLTPGNGGSPTGVIGVFQCGGGGGGSLGDAANNYSGGDGGPGGVDIQIIYSDDTFVTSSGM